MGLDIDFNVEAMNLAVDCVSGVVGGCEYLWSLGHRNVSRLALFCKEKFRLGGVYKYPIMVLVIGIIIAAVATILGGMGTMPEAVVPESMPGIISEDISEVIPEAMPEGMPEVIPKAILRAIYKAILRTIPEEMPEDALSAIIDVIYKAMSGAMPEATLETIPEAILEVIPEDAPEGVLEAIAKAIRGAISGAVPEVLNLPYERTCEEVLGLFTRICRADSCALYRQLFQAPPGFLSAQLAYWESCSISDLSPSDSFKVAFFRMLPNWAECLQSSPEYSELVSKFEEYCLCRYGISWTELVQRFTENLYDLLWNGGALDFAKLHACEVSTAFDHWVEHLFVPPTRMGPC